MDAQLQEALMSYATACASSNHALCGQSLVCRDGATTVSREREAEHKAATFDARQISIAYANRLPEHSWPTASLINAVIDRIRKPPRLGGLRRATAITSALARLGERGVEADWLVRTCIGPEFLRYVILVATNVWHRARVRSLNREQYPELAGWLDCIDSDAPADYNPETDRAQLMKAALNGKSKTVGEEWLHNAAIAHIIDWRLVDYVCTPIDPSDLTLPCGVAGTRWVYERFSQTYPQNWSLSSHNWEMAFIQSPEIVGERTGLTIHLLSERTVTLDQLQRASAQKVLVPTDDVLPGMGRQELFDGVVDQLEEGNVDSACGIAQAAVMACPDDVELRGIYAFCHIPARPGESRAILMDLESNRTMSNALRLVNIAATFLTEGDRHRAAETVGVIDIFHPDNLKKAWLWDPQSLSTHPVVNYCSVSQWLTTAKL